MSDTDQVLESVADAEPNEPVVTEAPEEVEEPEELSVILKLLRRDLGHSLKKEGRS